MAQRVAGICYIKVDGDQLSVKGSVEISLSNVTREAVMEVSKVAGFKEMARAPRLALTAIFVSTFPLTKVRDATNMTITTECANGRVHTLYNAFLVGETNLNVDEGEVTLEFNGDKGIWNDE